MVRNFAILLPCWSCLVWGAYGEDKPGSELWGRWKLVGFIESNRTSLQHQENVLFLIEFAKTAEATLEFQRDGTAIWYLNGKVQARARLQFVTERNYKIAHWVDPETGKEQAFFYRVQGDILFTYEVVARYKEILDVGEDPLDPFFGASLTKWVRVKDQGKPAQ